MKKDKVFIDTDVILDLLTEREPHFEAAVELFLQIQDKAILAYTSPVVIANIFYILNRRLDRKKAIQSLIKIKSLVKALNCGDRVIELALSSDFKDFEDSIQYYTALENNINILITRNVKDYKTANITISTPLEYIKSK
ncbi:VapC toxin family PIN domain ribonuclease [Candidatus Desulfarcum epimagneticum]|uniref:VapC toxin family PIN domain ribonuclease n=1 Tax=uncultured Desulfobacteraceae bacterium TaxID=218296 RepID=A0A484HKY8_9BACT|nr:VapC toxin family PIN domain ribonuclease [uncultured Desulfobacteraceae bacterium]